MHSESAVLSATCTKQYNLLLFPTTLSFVELFVDVVVGLVIEAAVGSDVRCTVGSMYSSSVGLLVGQMAGTKRPSELHQNHV